MTFLTSLFQADVERESCTMKNLYCFKHPQYRGDGAPVLSCKTCCGIFIALVKEQNAQAQAPQNPKDWLAEKAREAQAKFATAHVTP